MSGTALPLLLGGPIVRMCTQDELWFWVATSRQVTAVERHLTIFSEMRHKLEQTFPIRLGSGYRVGSLPLGDAPETRPPTHTFQCVKLGARLFVTLIGLWPKQGSFQTGVLYGYDLGLTLSEAGEGESKHWVTELAPGIRYPGSPLPTFYLPSGSSVLAQASCRRPGARGKDALLDLDARLEKTATSVRTRPSALFLTGDQIYADDVAHSLFNSLRALALDLMGYDERLPETYGRGGKYASEVAAADIVFTTPEQKTKAYSLRAGRWGQHQPLGTRRGNVLEHGFTTDDGEGHLLTFGEFAAMYLLVWNDELASAYGMEKNLSKEKWTDDPNLVNFTAAIRAARRVLANVPTYMIFDDHEVTDDWNISLQWLRQTDNLFARRVIANGLAAFWAFQGWGNTANEYSGDGSPLTVLGLVANHLRKQLESGGKLYPFNDRDFGQPMLAWSAWSFVAPTHPRVVVADLRTHRSYGRRKESHMAGEVHTRFLSLLTGKRRDPLILVLATPLLPWQPVVTLRSAALRLQGGGMQKELGDLFDDIPEGRARLAALIHERLDPRVCIVFSGDVHFSFVDRGSARGLEGGGTRWEMPILQVTCSPLKNESADLNQVPLECLTASAMDVAREAIEKEGVERRRESTWMQVSNLLEETMDTTGSQSVSVNGGVTVELEWEARSLRGALGNETVIAGNNCSLFRFAGARQIEIEFIGGGKRASYRHDL